MKRLAALAVIPAMAGCQLIPALLASSGGPVPAAMTSPGNTAAMGPTISFGASLEGTVSGSARLLGNTGSALIGNTGAALIGNTGAALIGNTGAAQIGNTGGALGGSSGSAPGGSSGGALGGNGAGRYAVQTAEQSRAAGAIVYLTTPGEELYRDPSGKVVSTIADDQGRYRIPADTGKPLIVTAVLPHNRRLVGFTVLSREGSASLDVSLETTYVTEYLRYQARKRNKTMAEFDQAKLGRIVDLTREMVAAGDLTDAPDIAIPAIPDLVQDYLVAVATKNKALSDAWTDLLGSRPLAVTTLDDSAGPSYRAVSVATGGDRVWASSFNSSAVEIREIGQTEPVFKGAGHQGFNTIQAMAVGPDGKLYFAERYDRWGGGILARDNRQQLRLFSFDPATRNLDEARLPVIPELASHVLDPGVRSAIEPSAMAWHGGRLYLADRASGLIYRYARTSSGVWSGELFAGQVQQGKPVPGFATGHRLDAARFRVPWHLAWFGEDLFVSTPADGVVRKIGPDGHAGVALGLPGNRGAVVDGTPAGEALLNFPTAMAFDPHGRMVVADRDNNRIVLVEGGAVRAIAGGSGNLAADGDAGEIALGEVGNLAFDAKGNLLFTDIGIGKVRRLWLGFGL